MNWSAADLERASKPQAATQERLKATRPPKSPVAAGASRKGGLESVLPKPTFGTLPGPCSWVRGGQSLAVAAALDPGRHRVVLTGPKDEALVAALLATLETYTTEKP